MKKIQLFIFGLVVTNIGLSQNRDTIKLPERSPVKCGYTFAPVDNSRSSYVDPINGVNIYVFSPACDSVFSLSKGKVKAMRKNDDHFICIIQTGKTLYAYSLLNSTELKPGDTIKKGDYVGQMGSDGYSKRLFLEVMQKKRALSFDKQLEKIIKN